MAKRRKSLSGTATKNGKHPRKTKKRLAVKAIMLAAKKLKKHGRRK